jgi:hypothetical protein
MMSLFYLLYAGCIVSSLSTSFYVSMCVFLVGSLFSAYDWHDLTKFSYVLTFFKSQVCLKSKGGGASEGEDHQ